MEIHPLMMQNRRRSLVTDSSSDITNLSGIGIAPSYYAIDLNEKYHEKGYLSHLVWGGLQKNHIATSFIIMLCEQYLR